MSGSYFLYGSILEKCGNLWKKRLFFRADMAGLGKCCMGGYGRIGVYRDNIAQGMDIGLMNLDNHVQVCEYWVNLRTSTGLNRLKHFYEPNFLIASGKNSHDFRHGPLF